MRDVGYRRLLDPGIAVGIAGDAECDRNSDGNGHPITESHRDPYANTDTNRDANADGDRNSITESHRDPYANTDTNRDANADGDRNSITESHRDPYTNADTNRDANADGDRNSITESHRDPYTNADTNRDAKADADRNSITESHRDPYTNADTNRDANADADRNSITDPDRDPYANTDSNRCFREMQRLWVSWAREPRMHLWGGLTGYYGRLHGDVGDGQQRRFYRNVAGHRHDRQQRRIRNKRSEPKRAGAAYGIERQFRERRGWFDYHRTEFAHHVDVQPDVKRH